MNCRFLQFRKRKSETTGRMTMVHSIDLNRVSNPSALAKQLHSDINVMVNFKPGEYMRKMF